MAEEWLDLLIMGAGAGAKGLIVKQVQKFIPEVGAEMAGIISGGLLYYFGDRIHPIVKKFGAGVLISSIGGFVEEMIPEGGGGGGGKMSQSPRRQVMANDLKSLAEMEAGRRTVYS